MEQMQDIFESVDAYIENLFVEEDDALRGVVQSAEAAGMPAIHISPSQGKFLYLLARMANASRVLEIGTLAGYSTIWLARALPEGGSVVSLELNPKHADVARANVERAGVGEKVEVRQGPALDALAALRSEAAAPFDLIFIDADKPGYPAYLEAVMPLTREGTVIIADNVIRKGSVVDTASTDEMTIGAQRFNEAFATRPDIEAIVLQQVGPKGHDGMAIGIVKAPDFVI
jgi:predicted O-methyltransferase YrrM